MDTPRPERVLDLGSGPGSLSSAARRRWPNAEITCVDIEPKVQEQNVTHFIADVCDYDLPDKIGLKENSVDVAISNPPYIKLEWKSELHAITEAFKLPTSSFPPKLYSAEIIFISQILRMLKPGGEAAVILPDGMLTAEKYAAFRSALIETHHLKKVIELPSRSFKKTEATTHIVVFGKASRHKKSTEIELRTIESNRELSRPIHISHEYGIQRLDYSHYKRLNLETIGNSIALSSIAMVLRGKQSSSEIKKQTSPTVHTTNIQAPTLGLALLGGSELLALEDSGYLIARPGDILIARVGRNLHKKVAFIKTGYAIVSDCLFVIRAESHKSILIFEYLASKRGQSAIQSLTYGVAARQISKKQLINLQMEIRT